MEIKGPTKDFILNNDKRQPREGVARNKRKREQKALKIAKKQASNKFVYRQKTGVGAHRTISKIWMANRGFLRSKCMIFLLFFVSYLLSLKTYVA